VLTLTLTFFLFKVNVEMKVIETAVRVALGRQVCPSGRYGTIKKYIGFGREFRR